MLKHLNDKVSAPTRTVIIGSGSFVGKALLKRLAPENLDILAIGRTDVDLTDADAPEKLAFLLRPADSVVTISAKAPCRNVDDYLVNARLIVSLCGALQKQPVAHLVNISSDAVYDDEPVPLTETAPAAPGSLHGAMHLSREIALATLGIPLGILRPTLIYGASDPHNGYGPNQFRRKANKGENIVLFGEGEERRDHVAVEDVADLCVRMLLHRSIGVLNAVSGTVTSFRAIADAAIRLSGKHVEIETRPRTGPMPHNGYRPFDPAATLKAFPEFRYTDLETGMTQAQAAEFPNG